jgi:butyrate kinase
MGHQILAINTGNTSTKFGVYNSQKPVFVETIRHKDEELSQYHDINAQRQFREDMILDFLEKKGIDIHSLNAVAARGGLLRPLQSGTYIVNEPMVKDLIEGKRGLHASNLSGQIGYDIANKADCTCYIVDPISVDEYEPIARYTGHKMFTRESLTHALNMKAVAKRYAKENLVDYKAITLIVVHLGTGISLSIHHNGRMIDAVNPTEEGPFAPDRTGGLPLFKVAEYIVENRPDLKSFRKTIFGKGGLYSYLGTTDFREVAEMCHNGNKEAIEVVDAMVYQVSKEVGALATVNYGKIDKIILTGGMAYQDFLVDKIKERVEFIAPIVRFPGEDEMEALAEGVCRVLDKEEDPLNY